MAKVRDEAEPLIPSPEATFSLVGQDRAEQELLAALKSGRMHHAWMLTGPKGIGKATLAFRLARFLLRYGRDEAAIAKATSLAVSAEDPISLQISRGVTQDLAILRREVDEKTDKEKTEITVDVVRRLQPFYGVAAGAGGWRVAIIDPADELNRNAANALLKLLEEPPQRALVLLVTNSPGRLFPTVRSRCRKLALDLLAPDLIHKEVARFAAENELADIPAADEALIARLAGGSLGRALELRAGGALIQYRALLQTLKAWPRITEATIQGLLDKALGRQWPDGFENLSRLILDTLQAVASAAAAGGTTDLDPVLAALARGAPAWAWAELAGDLETLFAKGEGLKLDERAVVAEAMRRTAQVSRNAA